MSKVYLNKYRGGLFDDGKDFPPEMREYVKKTVFGSVKIGQRRSEFDKKATGEMSKADVTREAYPIHFAIADAVGGTVEPFDVYQGPYISTDQGKLFITVEEGGMATVWNESTHNESNAFFYDDESGAIDAALSVLPKKPKVKKKTTPKGQTVSCDSCNEKYVQDPNGNGNGLCSKCSEFHDELIPKDKKIRTPKFNKEDMNFLKEMGIQGSKLALWKTAVEQGTLSLDEKRNRYRLASGGDVLKEAVAAVNSQLRRRHIPENPHAHEAAILRIASTMKPSSEMVAPANPRGASDTLTRFAKQAAQATHILYDASPTTYKVVVMRGDTMIDESKGTDSPYDGISAFHRPDSQANEYKRLLEYAKQTARELAEDYGVPEKMVQQDDSLMAEEREGDGIDKEAGSYYRTQYENQKPPLGVKLDPHTLPPDDPEAKARVEEKRKEFKSKALQGARRRDRVPENKPTKYSEDDLNYLLDWFSNMFGDLKPDIRKRLMAVINNPTEKTWNNAYSVLVKPFTTLWKAVIKVDPWFPKTGPSEDRAGNRIEGWAQIPTQELIIKALLNVAGLNSMPKKPTVDSPFSDEDKKIMQQMGITGSKITHETHFWPYGRHKFEPKEGSDECKACKMLADHKLHTTPPPTDGKKAFFSPEDATKFREENEGSNLLLPQSEEEEMQDFRQWEPVFDESGKPIARNAAAKTATVFKVDEEGGEWYIRGLSASYNSTYSDSPIYPGMNHSISTPEGLTEGLYEALYQELQVNDDLKEGDIFDTPIGQFICEGVQVLPYDEKAKAAVTAVDEQYNCANCGCDQGEHVKTDDGFDTVYMQCMVHPECKEYTKKGKTAAVSAPADVPPAIIQPAPTQVKPAFNPKDPVRVEPVIGEVKPALKERDPETHSEVYFNDEKGNYKEIK